LLPSPQIELYGFPSIITTFPGTVVTIRVSKRLSNESNYRYLFTAAFSLWRKAGTKSGTYPIQAGCERGSGVFERKTKAPDIYT